MRVRGDLDPKHNGAAARLPPDGYGRGARALRLREAAPEASAPVNRR
jgi:hypothetical protein